MQTFTNLRTYAHQLLIKDLINKPNLSPEEEAHREKVRSELFDKWAQNVKGLGQSFLMGAATLHQKIAAEGPKLEQMRAKSVPNSSGD
ncbi:MAG: hypothetical protein K0S07_1336 [Chlamydiales bacterium]|jgi:hypothetical protein|nr:hypothetical protein [Chlamydiales bacterium]